MTDTYKEGRDSWHQMEADFYNPCQHKNIIEDKIIAPEIGEEYVAYCRDCKKEL